MKPLPRKKKKEAHRREWTTQTTNKHQNRQAMPLALAAAADTTTPSRIFPGDHCRLCIDGSASRKTGKRAGRTIRV